MERTFDFPVYGTQDGGLTRVIGGTGIFIAMNGEVVPEREFQPR